MSAMAVAITQASDLHPHFAINHRLGKVSYVDRLHLKLYHFEGQVKNEKIHRAH